MEEASSSHDARLKFLCSYGGRILPRPSDGILRYVGGETRVLSVPRSITFTELKERIAAMFNADLVIKYQLTSEDLDALVSVKNEEDLYYMVDEYRRFHRRPRSPTSASSPRFRLFLFPSAKAMGPVFPVDQRYVDAINGGLPIPDSPLRNPLFSISSAETSPISPDSLIAVTDAGGDGTRIHRVWSTPNLGSGGNGGSQTSSPRAYKRPTGKVGGGGGFRQEIGYGCWCSCGCGCCWAQQMRKSAWSQALVEGSPPRRGHQGFHVGPPPPFAGPLRRAAGE